MSLYFYLEKQYQESNINKNFLDGDQVIIFGWIAIIFYTYFIYYRFYIFLLSLLFAFISLFIILLKKNYKKEKGYVILKLIASFSVSKISKKLRIRKSEESICLKRRKKLLFHFALFLHKKNGLNKLEKHCSKLFAKNLFKGVCNSTNYSHVAKVIAFGQN